METLTAMDPYEFDPNLGLDVQTLQDMRREFIAERVEQGQAALEVSAYVDESFLNDAVNEVGSGT
ncbi:MAG: hypothetical protein JOZ81_13195 [Chloroflexi bacterium]|nr:hypothetical protein [Chloroflexota bacterium]